MDYLKKLFLLSTLMITMGSFQAYTQNKDSITVKKQKNTYDRSNPHFVGRVQGDIQTYLMTSDSAETVSVQTYINTLQSQLEENDYPHYLEAQIDFVDNMAVLYLTKSAQEKGEALPVLTQNENSEHSVEEFKSVPLTEVSNMLQNRPVAKKSLKKKL